MTFVSPNLNLAENHSSNCVRQRETLPHTSADPREDRQDLGRHGRVHSNGCLDAREGFARANASPKARPDAIQASDARVRTSSLCLTPRLITPSRFYPGISQGAGGPAIPGPTDSILDGHHHHHRALGAPGSKEVAFMPSSLTKARAQRPVGALDHDVPPMPSVWLTSFFVTLTELIDW